MTTYILKNDIVVTGIRVTDFPNGIKEAFDELINNFGKDRDLYGISWMDNDGNVVYYAMAAAAFTGEGSHYHYQEIIIQKGKYITEAVHDWLTKTGCIKEVFHRLMGNNTPVPKHPCIEWYQSDSTMLCMTACIDG